MGGLGGLTVVVADPPQRHDDRCRRATTTVTVVAAETLQYLDSVTGTLFPPGKSEQLGGRSVLAPPGR